MSPPASERAERIARVQPITPHVAPLNAARTPRRAIPTRCMNARRVEDSGSSLRSAFASNSHRLRMDPRRAVRAAQPAVGFFIADHLAFGGVPRQCPAELH